MRTPMLENWMAQTRYGPYKDDMKLRTWYEQIYSGAKGDYPM
jgi:hypothetical protein